MTEISPGYLLIEADYLLLKQIGAFFWGMFFFWIVGDFIIPWLRDR